MKQSYPTVSLRVAAYLKAHIESGDWAVGTKIPSEHTLTRLLKASRASVRSAIQQLVAVGVLESIHGKGSFVRSLNFSTVTGLNRITPQDCADLRRVLEFRQILEPEACAMAAKKSDESFLQELSEHLERMHINVGNPKRFVQEDRLFHEAIARMSGNPLLEKSLRDVFENTTSDHLKMNEIFGYSSGIYHHTMILHAIQKGDVRLARRWMKTHLGQAIARLQEDSSSNIPEDT